MYDVSIISLYQILYIYIKTRKDANSTASKIPDSRIADRDRRREVRGRTMGISTCDGCSFVSYWRSPSADFLLCAILNLDSSSNTNINIVNVKSKNMYLFILSVIT